jgi:hypothetical protein
MYNNANSNTSNDNSRTAQIGQVVVNVQQPPSYSTGGAIASSIHSQLVGNANYGTGG